MIDNIMYADHINTAQKLEGVKPAGRSSDTNAEEPEKASENRDVYVPGEEREPIGLYSVAPDENGEPQISFDRVNDKSADNADEPEKNTATANTDKVDREIKKLRDKVQTLRQRLRSADESKAADIQRELEKASAELAQKDNDQYRRQNAVFT